MKSQILDVKAKSPADLPLMVDKLSLKLKENEATRGRQTSMVSKFCFSLCPENIVPYDKTARGGLGDMFGNKIPEHDYPIYLKAFLNFEAVVSEQLDDSGITEEFRPKWDDKTGPKMSKRLFELRAADKYFMLLGGFNIEDMLID